jgi:hypothetical protein
MPPSVLYFSRFDTAADEAIVQWSCNQGSLLNETLYVIQHPILGEVFELKKPHACNKRNTRLTPYFDIFYDGSKNVQIHTSCSYPMYLGQRVCDRSYCLPLHITGFCNQRGDLHDPPGENSMCGYYSQPLSTLSVSTAPSAQPTTESPSPTRHSPTISAKQSFTASNNPSVNASAKPSISPSTRRSYIPSVSEAPFDKPSGSAYVSSSPPSSVVVVKRSLIDDMESRVASQQSHPENTFEKNHSDDVEKESLFATGIFRVRLSIPQAFVD